MQFLPKLGGMPGLRLDRLVGVPLHVRTMPVDLPAVGLARVGGLGGGPSIVSLGSRQKGRISKITTL